MTKKSKHPYAVRQGDCYLRLLPSTPEGLAPVPKDPRGIVLADGEQSFHHHQVFGRGCKLMRFRDGNAARVLVVGRAGAEVRVVGGGSGGVPRHHPVSLVPGSYEVRIQKSWSLEDERASQVQD